MHREGDRGCDRIRARRRGAASERFFHCITSREAPTRATCQASSAPHFTCERAVRRYKVYMMHGYHAHRARAGGVGNAALERQCRLLLVGLARLLQRSTGGVQQGSGASRDHRAPEQACAAPMGGTESLQGPRAGQVASMFTDRRRFFCDLQDRSGWSSKHEKKCKNGLRGPVYTR